MNEWYRDLDRVGGAHHLIVLRDRDDVVVGITDIVWDSRSDSPGSACTLAISPAFHFDPKPPKPTAASATLDVCEDRTFLVVVSHNNV